jgi:ribosomal protein L36
LNESTDGIAREKRLYVLCKGNKKKGEKKKNLAEEETHTNEK